MAGTAGTSGVAGTAGVAGTPAPPGTAGVAGTAGTVGAAAVASTLAAAERLSAVTLASPETSAPLTAGVLIAGRLDRRGLDGGRSRNCGDSRELGSSGDGGRSGGHLCVLRAGDLGRVGQSDAGESSDGDDGGSDSNPGGLANTLHKKKTSFGWLKAGPEADGGQPPARRLHRGNRSARARRLRRRPELPWKGARGMCRSGGPASVRGLRSQVAAAQNRRSCPPGMPSTPASGSIWIRACHTEHIAQVHEQLVDARLAVQHRNHSQAFAVIGAYISHLSELIADRPRPKPTLRPCRQRRRRATLGR